jgi:azurin
MSGMPIKTPKQLIAVIVAAFIVPIFIIVLLTQYVGNSPSPTENKNAYTEEAISKRISPIGIISTEPVAALTISSVNTDQATSANTSLTEDKVLEPCNEIVTAADNMMFNKNKIVVDYKCDLFTIKFKHTGALPAGAGGHNIVIVESEKFDSIVSKIDMKLGEKSGYLPDIPEIIAKTAIIGGGQEVILKISPKKLLKEKKYTFFCSFPGHYAMMKGEIG